MLLDVEKLKPHHDLTAIKAAFGKVEDLRMTKTAHDGALGLGLALQDVVDLIQKTTRSQFYKSMTTIADSKVWQDVYRVPWKTKVLYLKFTTDAQGFLVISLKEK
jgi:motility quorum-sensing regulator/GCU-specific mRNA interferase toxin